MHRRVGPAGMTLALLARASGETIHAVRYYARIGLIRPEAIEANGYRRFGTRALSRLAFIRRAQHLGFTLEEIATFVSDAEMGQAPCPRVRQLLSERLPEVTTRLADAGELLARMQAAQRRWKRRRDRPPTGDEICHLIESTL